MRPRPRRTQLEAVLGTDWLGHPDCNGIKVFCGDLNTFPSSTLYQNITDKLKDTAQKSNKGSPQGTFFTRFPATRIDYIFVNEQTEVLTTRVPNTELTRLLLITYLYLLIFELIIKTDIDLSFITEINYLILLLLI